MPVRISRLYGLDIYTNKARYVGNAFDFIIDVDKGEVVAISLEEESYGGKVLGVPYKRVLAVGDIILIKEGKEEQKRVKLEKEKIKVEAKV
ncbi:hypothetical protein B6U74_07115 [Candidatus Bathyarchaeota archaeon ex4484_205]|nr:MAG: hypothetical protein B6U74_07115 [Candidatus Bathyarchaeota archaeon ex4484_205]RLF90889.1 MAG: hypothetical protein DRN46_02595 [Thermococci archaeon]RLF93541.1 MAG: hypothetical protein DRN52_06340 [Thermococci archaeon]